MFGRPSLRVLLCSQHREVVQCHAEVMRRQENQHEEFMRYQEKRDTYEKRRDEREKKRDERERKRDEEFLARNEEFREFNREILLRNEKIYTALIAEVEEGRKQIQANTEAVLSVLDRLEGSGGIAA